MIVSNCQAGYIETFLSWSELTRHFADIECWGNTRRAKPYNLATVIERNQLRRPVFVGDTQGDCDAAQANGCQFIHAAYGFGDASSADARIHAFSDLGALLSIPSQY